MNNLFSIFDPSTSNSFSLNWSVMIISLIIISSLTKPNLFNVSFNRTSSLFLMIMKTLFSEFKIPMSNKVAPFLIQLCLISFLQICTMNFMGLTPYTFTPTSSISLTVCLAIIVWIMIEISFFLISLSSFLSHLVPSGTPAALIPLMVLIELVSNFIRPITLSVRLAANMVAGHLLISLVNGGTLELSSMIFMISGGLILFFLEVGVSFIQGYVFSTLSVMYLSEFNSSWIIN